MKGVQSLGAAKCSIAALVGRGVSIFRSLVVQLVRGSNRREQIVRRRQIVLFFGSRQRFFDAVVPWNDARIGGPHQLDAFSF